MVLNEGWYIESDVCEHTDWVAVMTMKAIELTRYCKKSKTSITSNDQYWVSNLKYV